MEQPVMPVLHFACNCRTRPLLTPGLDLPLYACLLCYELLNCHFGTKTTALKCRFFNDRLHRALIGVMHVYLQ